MKLDPNKPAVLDWSDEAVVTDRDGDLHSVFIQHRRLLVLSVPKSVDVGSPVQRADLVEDLVDVVVEAMEEGPR